MLPSFSWAAVRCQTDNQPPFNVHNRFKHPRRVGAVVARVCPSILDRITFLRRAPVTARTPNMGKLTSTIGIPIKLLNEAQGHVVTLELTSGQVYRGKLLEAEDNMNVQLKDITATARDGRVSHLDQVYIRGSHVRFFIVPDMLRNAPMFRSRGTRGRGVGLARGRATVNRARAGRRN
ncbi:small nuclear ribonucleoprotein Sm D3 [Fonsecaea erecta]|uniref:Small nuclear ribonucleoprotein Sm D3 n=9 Tax=Herpotrichiellaceae TaxID=43219 RepID=A0A178ZSP1_9EURO|nr:small nuclear ribonucleoprotein Sm D3 [Fonsecaea erecta]OAP62819.1 small nuclear ribonucleoprotein Sm D3 [Fonsecaea erecta]